MERLIGWGIFIICISFAINLFLIPHELRFGIGNALSSGLSSCTAMIAHEKKQLQKLQDDVNKSIRKMEELLESH